MHEHRRPRGVADAVASSGCCFNGGADGVGGIEGSQHAHTLRRAAGAVATRNLNHLPRRCGGEVGGDVDGLAVTEGDDLVGARHARQGRVGRPLVREQRPTAPAVLGRHALRTVLRRPVRRRARNAVAAEREVEEHALAGCVVAGGDEELREPCVRFVVRLVHNDGLLAHVMEAGSGMERSGEEECGE